MNIYLCACYQAKLLHTSFASLKCGVIRFLMDFGENALFASFGVINIVSFLLSDTLFTCKVLLPLVYILSICTVGLRQHSVGDTITVSC